MYGSGQIRFTENVRFLTSSSYNSNSKFIVLEFEGLLNPHDFKTWLKTF